MFINASRSTNTLRFGKHPKEHRKGPSNHPCEELPYEAGLSALAIYDMLFIKESRPTLNTQTDSVPAKLFTVVGNSILLFSMF